MPVDNKPAVAAGSRPPAGGPSVGLLAALAALVVALDQASKALVRLRLPLHDRVEIVPGLLDFTHVRNTGAAFGLLNAADIPFKPLLMTIIALVALAGILWFASQTGAHERLTRIGLALVCGGATGNLIDRITAGHVVDFVDVHWSGWHFWTFNVADSAITVGACLLILDMVVLNRHVSTTA